MSEPGQRMSLLEAYAELKPDKQTCSMGTMLESLEEGDRVVLMGWLADASMTNNSIARLLTHAGHTVHRNTVAEHRRGVCRCNR